MKNPLDLFAADVRAARIKRNLTQRQLADKLHMSVRTIIEIERCKAARALKQWLPSQESLISALMPWFSKISRLMAYLKPWPISSLVKVKRKFKSIFLFANRQMN